MHHAGVKQTINGHSPRFLPVNFALKVPLKRNFDDTKDAS